MDPFHKHILERLDNLEGEIRELRAVTWPVCQGLVDRETGPFANMKQKRSFFRFLDIDEARKLLNFKAKFMGVSKDLVVEELQQVLVEVPRVPSAQV